MWKNWTDNRIDWNDYDTSTAYGANWNYGWMHYQKPEPVYRNGQRLKKNEQRPIPFYIKILDFHVLPCYNVIVQKQICRRLIRGAYSRKYDKVRKKRKRRIF